MGFGKDGKGVIMHSQAGGDSIASLASGTAVKLTTTGPSTLTEDFRLIKVELSAAVQNLTDNDGPVMIGLADNELTIAEIAECLQADVTDRNDRLEDEKATRPVWILSTYIHGSEIANNGLPIEKTIRWTFSNTEGFCLFAYNASNSTNTTGDVVHHAKYFGVWVT